MGEKLYKPILKDGDHLVKSKENDGRVRGVSQDANNKTTDIVEWEEVEVVNSSYEDDNYTPQRVELTPEEQRFAEMVGAAIAAGIIYGVGKLNEYVIQPWWHNSARPWLTNKISDAKSLVVGKAKASKITKEKNYKQTSVLMDVESTTQIDDMLNKAFESIQFDMSTEEAKKHIMNLIYHMIGIAYEIKVLSNARIVEHVEDENMRLENQAKAERLISEKVANNINQLLSDEHLLLDVATSKQLFSLFGGGIRINEEYVPVETEKIGIAIDSMKKQIL